jgi:hypothetical protein
MRPTKYLIGAAFSVVRLVAIAADVANQRIAAASGGGIIVNVMNDRQLQDLGLSPTHVQVLKDNFSSAEAQLGMVR